MKPITYENVLVNTTQMYDNRLISKEESDIRPMVSDMLFFHLYDLQTTRLDTNVVLQVSSFEGRSGAGLPGENKLTTISNFKLSI